ncbi:MAG: hypothetical protein J0L63_10955 [Anaerolineae bacterium]|nr:hypothetical protein [Anaerolineae bacterium]
MPLSESARFMLGLILITVPTIQFGGYFLLTQMGRGSAIRSELQRAYFRAGHAHAGVLVLLALIAQPLVDSASLASALQWPVRIGFMLAPILISAGFFGAAPREGTQPGRLIVLIYAGAFILVGSVLALGLGLLFQ